MSARKLIVVHGATGTQGRPIAERLLADGHGVRAAVRDPAPARLPAGSAGIAATLSDTDALAAAYDGADAVVIVLPGPASPDDVAVAEADAVLRALAAARVPQAILLTSGAVWSRPVGVPFLDARIRLSTALQDAVAHATVLATPTRYAENLEEPWVLERLQQEGVLEQVGPPDDRVAWLALDDVAAQVAALVEDPEPPGSVTLTGPEDLSGNEALDALGAALGRSLTWRAVSFADYNQHVREHLGAHYADGMARLYGASSRVPPPARLEGPALRGTTTLEAWARGRTWATGGRERSP